MNKLLIFDKNNFSHLTICEGNRRQILKIIKTVLRFLAIILFKKRYPLIVNFRITNKCNGICIYCSIPKREPIEISKSDVFKLIDEISDTTLYINLYGGEALLHNNIGEVIDHIKSKKNIFLSLSSNGYLVDGHINDLKKLDLLFLSIDGREELHDKQRGKGSFKKVINALELARENGIPVVVMTAITKYNLCDVDYLLELAHKYRFSITFQPVITCAQDNTDINPPIGEFRETMKRLSKLKDRHIAVSSKTLRYYTRWPEKEKNKINCLVDRLSCFIESNGELYSCTTVCDFDYKLGVHKNSVFKKGVKKAFLDVPTPQCNDCWAMDSVEVNKNSLILNGIKRLIFKKI